MRIALLNNKGGVGKTFDAVALAEVLASKGKRVLVVDMDPQANATRRLGVEPGALTLTDVLRVGVRLGDAAGALRPCGWPAGYATGVGAIDVLPSTLALEDRTLEAGRPGSLNRLRKALFQVDDDYDATIIDCPPSIGHLTTLAVAALDERRDTVLCPLTPESDAIAGALRVVAYMDQVADDLGVQTRVTGLIVNAVRATALHEDRVNQLPETFLGIPLLGTIPLRARVAELLDGGQPLSTDQHASSSAVAVRATFDAIADHLLTRQETFA